MRESIATIAIDHAKSVFEIAVSSRAGRVTERRRLARSRFLEDLAKREPSEVLLEASSSAHYWARQLRRFGHQVKLLPPHRVRPYRVGNKTDRADAKALLEAARNEELCPVPVKSVEQQSLMALHRLRSGWVATRTARINTVRGLLREIGLTIPVGARKVVPRVVELIEDAEAELSAPLRGVLAEVCDEIRELESRIGLIEEQLEALGSQTPAVERLQSVPGIGLLAATALVGFVGEIHRFPSSRHFASYLGLTPREHSSGSTRRLGRISKRGDRYLRTLLVHGARSVLRAATTAKQPCPLQLWGRELQQRSGHNKAVVALANKISRFAWVVWSEDRAFERLPQAA